MREHLCEGGRHFHRAERHDGSQRRQRCLRCHQRSKDGRIDRSRFDRNRRKQRNWTGWSRWTHLGISLRLQSANVVRQHRRLCDIVVDVRFCDILNGRPCFRSYGCHNNDPDQHQYLFVKLTNINFSISIHIQVYIFLQTWIKMNENNLLKSMVAWWLQAVIVAEK